MGRCSREDRRDIDGGWAWLVMVMTFLGMFIYCLALFMGGIIFTALLHKYKEGAAKTSLIGSLSFGFLCFLGPLAGVVINKFSCRVAIVTGGILTSTGFALSAFATSLSWTIVTAGGIVGIGFSLSSAGLICALGFYFIKWRDQMIAIAFILVAASMFPSAPVGLYLIDKHGLAATFLSIAAIQAQMIVIGMVCKPSIIEMEVHTQRKKLRKESKADKLSQYLDLTLLKNFAFLSFLISTSAWNFALCVALMHLPNYITVLGGGDSEINLLMTSFSISNLIGRLIGLIAISKLKLKCLFVHFIVLFITGIITTTFPYYSNLYGGTYMFTIQLGVFCGIPNSMMAPVAIRFVGLSKLSEAYGLSYLFCGFGVSTGPFIIGYIYGRTGSYVNSFLVAGVVLLVGSAFGLASICFGRSGTDKNVLEMKVDEESKNATYIDVTRDTLEVKALTDSRTTKDIL